MSTPPRARFLRVLLLPAVLAVHAGCSEDAGSPSGSRTGSLPKVPLGVQVNWGGLKDQQGLEVTVEKIRLGRLLFFDRRLSPDGTRNCATCHDPGSAFAAPPPPAEAPASASRRQVPALINLGFPLAPVYSWNGAASSLVAQSRTSLEDAAELGASPEHVVATVSGLAGYATTLQKMYGSPLTIDHVADVLAAYVATRLSGNSSWDRWRKGDERAVSDDVRQGYDLFMGPARCSACHRGWNFTDSGFHNLGVGWNAGEQAFTDPGRFAVTGEEDDRGAFKTPTLRDVALHPPYMHDGSLATLRDVVVFYNDGGVQNPGLDGRIVALDLTSAQIDQIVAFLESLTGEGYQDTPPEEFP